MLLSNVHLYEINDYLASQHAAAEKNELAVIKTDVEPEKRKSQNVRNGLVLLEVRT